MASVHEVIEAFRQAPSNAERGAKFEQLMVRYFELDPMLSATYERVWRWMDWPDRPGPDTGIDLVARRRDDGELCAIQCKFYEPTHMLSKADIDSFFTASGKQPFTSRIIISTTDKWGKNAEDALSDQTIPVSRIGLADIAESPIAWDLPSSGNSLNVTLQVTQRNEPRPHQEAAIQAVLAGLEQHDRGRLIMACGTGKTFTALKLAERWADEHGDGAARVLFCVPSIQLLSQSLREWTAQSTDPIRSFAVCSDPKASRSADREDISAHDVPLPASTDPAKLTAQVRGGRRARGLTVVFCTYQSLPVVAQAQKDGLEAFDLVVCDEAHRTTGVTLVGDHESNFVRVHDNTYLQASKRVYMTATPRIFADEVKGKAEEHSALLASMDDEELFGPELYRLSFGEAVEQRLLSDYKVLVLTVDEEYIAGPLQSQIVDSNGEIRLDDATKIVGCWNGLAKRAGADLDGNGFPPGSVPMKRAVAFLRDIASSQRLSTAFESVIDAYDGTDDDVLDCTVRHVDGTMNALTRNEMLSWLKAPVPAGECRILSNARCLSEGVDVPALDAVMFLNPRNSIVDVVQSVGRVMRRAEGKDYGYIILPVGVPSGIAPEKALADNKRFKVVWDVLNALRAHDDRFNAMVNSIELNQAGDQPGGPGNGQLMGGHIPATGADSESVSTDGGAGTAGQVATQAALFSLTDWRDAVFAKIVKKVGTRTYWEDWAADVADIAATQRTRIRAAVEQGPAELQQAFAGFVQALRDNLNDSITDADAVSMLSQHLITKPVFDALFEGYSFAAQNPVSQVMQAMLDQLDGAGLDAETQDLAGFYDSVRVYASQVTSAAGKQQVITELYERFFKLAFAKQADALGIVYTPIEVVDWLLRAANDVLETELGQTLSDHGVHILDGFAGTGTFIVRLLQSGVIRPADLAHKYAQELHANEIVLLAYYIAAVNIEATYHALAGGEYQPFPGITLTDTFQISEEGDRADTSLLPANNDRISAQLDTPITVIVGNPPYSVGQGSANDDNANLAYPTLDARIGETYAARTTARSRRTLYDSYLRAFRWASDRIGDRGVTAFVSNGGWIDANTGDGIRLSLADEYSALWVFNLRGNQLAGGERSRREGGKIFGTGSRATIALLVGVKNPAHAGPCRIYYRDIGDYLGREEKLAILDHDQLTTAEWDTVTPNPHGDWIGQRSNAFADLVPLGDKNGDSGIPTVFKTYSLGLATGRDAWVYNFSRFTLEANVQRMINNYNADLADGVGVDQDPTRINWNRNLRSDYDRGKKHDFHADRVYQAAYRPFTREHLYYDRSLNAMTYQLASIFPTSGHRNRGILVMAPRAEATFATLVVDQVPDLASFTYATQFFPRWTYVKADVVQEALDAIEVEVDEWGYRRIDNITSGCLTSYRSAVGDDVTSDDVFYWVYGVLHAPDYRATFAADLKKMLPRIPLPTSRAQFDTFVSAGRELADLHLGAETVEPHPLVEHHSTTLADDDLDLWRVTKMKWRSKTDHSAIVYNGNLTLTDVPAEAHHYALGSRTALEWVMERYQVKIDKASGIRNDPNDWAAEHEDPRYIVDLIKRVTAISVRTVAIVDQLALIDGERKPDHEQG